MIEEWKDIKGYEGIYQASNLGQIRNLKFGKNKLRKLQKDNQGRTCVMLCKNGEKKMHRTSRLVASTFYREIEPDEVVMHIDNNPSNNRIKNLKIGTQSENIQQSHDEGRSNHPRVHGEKSGMAKLTESQVLRIRFIRDYIKISRGYWVNVARALGVDKTSVYRVLHNKSWKHLNKI